VTHDPSETYRRLWGESKTAEPESPQPSAEAPAPTEEPFWVREPVADQYAPRQYEPIRPGGTDWRGILRRIWAPLAAVGAFLAKFGAILFKLKFFTVAGTMIVSVGAYALLGGWWFGVGLVILIFIHEMGHVLELKRQGVPASAPLFIPFMGAVVGMKEMPHNAWREAQVALAGPVLGTLGAAAVWAYGSWTDSNFWIAMAFVGFFINLFNLLPIVPLDGGRAVAALHPAIWAVGLAGLVVLAIYRPSPILPIIIIFGAMELWRRWQTRNLPQFQDYYKVEWWQRAVVFTVYVGLAVLLVLGMHETHVPRDF
jgi:Zn-dependent protease